MNISLIKLRSVVRELSGIRSALERIAACSEADLSQKGYNITTPPPITHDESEISYVDEEVDWAKEQFDFLRREDERAEKEAEESDVFKRGDQ